ncbi:hypothetical protein LCGC14_3002170, partial [marine sediment metagenome]
LILIWWGMIVWKIGEFHYGSDAALLWASGVITYIGVMGLARIVVNLYIFYKEQNEGDDC